jgi:bacillithiol biosynthesis cysteine-adding enzyme BshC
MEILNTQAISKSPFYNGLISDYTEKHPDLKTFIKDFPSKEKLIQHAKKKDFSSEQRSLLFNVLREQYKKAGLGIPESVNTLSKPNTFTITTGHQLNLFSGPIYTLLKIASIIKLCNELKAEDPDHNYVPLFWMATEDHDWEEINKATVFGNELFSAYRASGPVGRIPVREIRDVLKSLMDVLGDRYDPEMKAIIQTAYEKGTLAEASFKFYSTLFKHTNLVILDADKSELKSSFAPIIRKDLFENSYSEIVSKSSKKLASTYKSQAYPREINVFYMLDGYRERIEKFENGFKTADDKFSWSDTELKTEIDNNPENFSPNVILRPVYQETILPNLAYVGGGGELAYWMQLKEGFNCLGVDFPYLILRDTGFFIRKGQWKKWQSLGLGFEDFFKEKHTLLKEIALKNSQFDDQIELPENWSNWIEKNKAELEEIDPSLVQSFEAELSRWEKSIEKLKGKKTAAIKKRQEISLSQVEKILEKCFPGGGLNERVDSFLDYYESGFFKNLMEISNPTNLEIKAFLMG